MGVTLNPYLSFRDNARQAMQFYQGVFGGKLDIMTFKENHVSEDSGEDNKIMHAELRADNDLVLMGSDVPNSMPFAGMSTSISLSGGDEATLRRYWQGLAADGMVEVPLEKAPWGDTFGMLSDKFGVRWLVNISAQQG